MSGTRPPRAWPEPAQERVEQRIVVARDGTIVARSGKVEYGQGIRTGFARIVAEELDVSIAHVHMELGETDRVPWDMGTFGSMSTAVDGKRLRAAAAFARQLLIDRASRRFGCTAADLFTADGCVRTRDGREAAYAELTEHEPLTGAIPERVAEMAAQAMPVDTPLRLEARDILTGKARFVADVRLAGMLRGCVLQPPVDGAHVVKCDDDAARALPGVVAVVRDGDFLGAVAERHEQARAAVHALRVEWTEPEATSPRPATLTLRGDDGVGEAIASASTRVEAHYEVPHIAHASIGPSAAVADVRPDGADLYVTAQRPFGVRDEAAELLGLPAERVHVHPQGMSGVYGRGNMSDAAIDAVRLSRAVLRPVLVQWSREDEFRHSPHRPMLQARLSAALDATGGLAAWRSELLTNYHTYGGTALPPRVLEMTSGRNAIPPYRLPAAEIVLHVVPAAIRTGAYRSLAAAPNVFAIESFVDELAHASGQDPVAFRLRHADDVRLRRVLEAAADRSGWARRTRADGRGYGVACAIYHGTYIAEIAETTVGEDRRVRVERVWCAVDAGRLVHPDGARNQIEGAVQQAASWTILEELRLDGGHVVTATWSDYPIATFLDAPRDIDVVFTGDSMVASTGTGEPGSVPTAAAIANAVFDACGIRMRRLPLTPSALAATARR